MVRARSGVIGRRRLRIAASFVAAITTALLAAFVAGAHDTDFNDPNDTRGKLDVRQVKLAHDSGAPRWTVVTFAEWGAFEMWDRGYVEVLLDTRRKKPPEYYVLVRSSRSELQGTLWRLHAVGPDSHLGSVPVTRPSRRSVSVQLGLWRLEFGENRDFYRWQVHTVFTSDVCRRTCHDDAPNLNPVLQWRPGRSPTPSVSPSPSSSPSSSPSESPSPSP
jgi:hypothetical protein